MKYLILKVVMPRKTKYYIKKNAPIEFLKDINGLYIVSDEKQVKFGIASKIVSGKKENLLKLGNSFTGNIKKVRKNSALVAVPMREQRIDEEKWNERDLF